jgi:hypothetical protein
MAKKPQPDTTNVTVLVPNTRSVETMIRQLAASSDNIAWSDHAFERMTERGITDVIALDVLRTGFCNGVIEAGKKPGEWKAKMTKPVKGRREVGVVVLTVRNARLFIKTVEWEDLT